MKNNTRIKGLTTVFILSIAAMLVSLAFFDGEFAGYFLLMVFLTGAGIADWGATERNKNNRGLFSDKTDDCELD